VTTRVLLPKGGGKNGSLIRMSWWVTRGGCDGREVNSSEVGSSSVSRALYKFRLRISRLLRNKTLRDHVQIQPSRFESLMNFRALIMKMKGGLRGGSGTLTKLQLRRK